MVTRIPERHRIEYTERGATVVAEELLTVEDLARAGGGKQPPPTVAQVAGPTWQQFLFSQLILVVAVALIAGPIAYALVLRARDAQPAPTTAPAAAGASNPALAAAAAPAGLSRLPLPQVAPPVGQREATTVKVEIETIEVTGLMEDGVAYTYWTFGGTVPGPMVRVRQGDTVELTLKNSPQSTVAHNIDLHAVTGPGGGAEATMIQPGEAKTFTFKAMNPGVYVYHCAMPPVMHHIAAGMYGLIVVEPPQGMPRVDREFYVMQGDFYFEGGRGEGGRWMVPQSHSHDHADAHAIGTDLAKLRDERPDYIVFNGSVGALTGENALKARVGETVRIFFGVGGPNVTSSFHVIGEIFDRVAPEGGALEEQSRWLTNVQTTGVPAGGATVVEFKLDVPGTYVLVDHSLSRAGKGGAGHLVVEGAENPDIFKAGR
jgi:nitrite reductase (NO-forming)